METAAGNKKGGYAYLIKSDEQDENFSQYARQHVIRHLIVLLRDFPIPGIHPGRIGHVHLFSQ